MRTICLICMLCLAVVVKAASPIQGLLERIDKGASRKFVIEQVKSYFLPCLRKNVMKQI